MTATLAKDPARFAETRIGEEVVVMNLATGDFFSLTGTARAIWELLDGVRDRDGIIAELSERYEADLGCLAADFDAFIGELDAARLLVRD